MVQFLPLFGRQAVPCLEYYTILYMLLIVTQMMLDAAYFQSIIVTNTGPESVEKFSLYQCIIIPAHCLQSTLQFFFGFDLYKATVKKSFRRARNWQMIFFCLLAVEVSLFIAYAVLSSFFSIFTYMSGGAILFKVYLVWPVRIFLEECHEVCVPLAQVSQHQFHPGSAPHLCRPGPSTSSAARQHGAHPQERTRVSA